MKSLKLLLSMILSLGATLSWAVGDALIQGNGVTITVDDVLADADRLPSELRTMVLKDPRKVEQIATNLFIRRAVAQLAKKAGLEKDREAHLAAAQQLVVDRILSDAFFAKAIAEAMPPDEQALEKLAHAVYDAEDRRFRTPEQRKIRHILIGSSTPDAKTKASEVLKRLQEGADFVALAKELSDDPGTRQKGGDLGYVGRDQMVKPFEEAAFGLKKPGDLSAVVETEFGYHILRLEEVRPMGTKKPYDAVSAEIKAELRAKLEQDRRQEVVASVRGGDVRVIAEAIEAFAKRTP